MLATVAQLPCHVERHRDGAEAAAQRREIGRTVHRVEGHPHEEAAGFGLVELLGIEDVLSAGEQEGRDRRDDSGTVGAGQSEDKLLGKHGKSDVWMDGERPALAPASSCANPVPPDMMNWYIDPFDPSRGAMAGRLSGYRILILETREEAQFSRLLRDQGADVIQCPMFTIEDTPDQDAVGTWIKGAIHEPLDDLVLMTGEGVRRLVAAAKRIGVENEFIAALGRPRKFARGPKPVNALRPLGRSAEVVAEPPTTEGIIATLSRTELKGHRVSLQLYPEKDHSPLLAAEREAGATHDPVAPYVYDTKAAHAEGAEEQLRLGLAQTPVASIGPVGSNELKAYGLQTDISPAGDAFFMKPLIQAIIARLTQTPPR